MITKVELENYHIRLEYYKSLKINDIKLEDLKDINEIHIDTSLPVIERILSFMVQIGNPYLFKVGDTPVKVSFSKNGPTIQNILESFYIKKT